MQTHLVEPAALSHPVEQVVKLYRRGGDLDTAPRNARLADHFEFGCFKCAASKQQRVIQRLFDPYIKPRINTPAQKLN